MRRQLPTRTIAVALLCLIVVASFAIAQTLPIRGGSSTGNDSNNPSTSAPASTPQTSGTTSATGRNLAQYAAAGPFSLRDDISPTARRQAASQMRSFIWQKWQSKQRGRASYVSTIIRGYAPGTSTFYVEPDERGEWRIALEVQGQDAPQYFYSVAEVGVDTDGLPINTESGQKASETRLELNPKDGNEGMIL